MKELVCALGHKFDVDQERLVLEQHVGQHQRDHEVELGLLESQVQTLEQVTWGCCWVWGSGQVKRSRSHQPADRMGLTACWRFLIDLLCHGRLMFASHCIVHLIASAGHPAT